MYLTEWAEFNFSRDQSALVWSEELVYGSWDDGPDRDGSRSTYFDLPVPEVSSISWIISALHGCIGVFVYPPSTFSPSSPHPPPLLLPLLSPFPLFLPLLPSPPLTLLPTSVHPTQWHVVHSRVLCEDGLPFGPSGRGLLASSHR